MQWTLILAIASAACGRLDFNVIARGTDATVAPDAPVGSATLVAWWKLDETSGSVAHDSSGHGHDGTLTASDTWKTGVVGGALSIGNGPSDTADFVDFGSAPELAPIGSMSISAWINARSFHLGNLADDVIVAHHDFIAGEISGWKLDGTEDCSGTQHFAIYVTIANSNGVERCSNTVPATDAWYHVAGTYDAGTQELHVYVNGVLDDGVLTGTVPATQVEPMTVTAVRLGDDVETPSGLSLDGTLDDVRIYLGVLDATAIAQLATP